MDLLDVKQRPVRDSLRGLATLRTHISRGGSQQLRAGRIAIFVLAAVVVLGSVFVALGSFSSSARAQTSPSGNGAKRFDDLRELNNKLERAMKRVHGELTHKNSVVKDTGRERRTLNDLEATKLRAVDQFPDVFGLPYPETFTRLSCIDENIAVGKIALHELERPYLTGTGSGHGDVYASRLLLVILANAKACKDELEADLRGTSVPAGISNDLRELNNKLERAMKRVHGELTHKNSVVKDTERERRTLNDLEATKLRAVGQFPEVIDPPYIDIFTRLSCIDENIAVGKIALHELERPYLTGTGSGHGDVYASRLLLVILANAKACKDELEIELLHSFDLKPSEQTEVGVNQTTPNGTDTRKPSKLNAPKPLRHAYAHNGFVGRHEHDYVATGVDGRHPDSWPTGRNVLFFDVFDLFNTTRGARKVVQASEQNLTSHGFAPVRDSSLGSGEKVFQLRPAGSQLLSTIIYVRRGTFILKIAGSCKGCTKGSIESSLKTLAQTQLAQAVRNGFPAGSGGPASGGCTGHAMLANIYGGQAHELVSDFSCPKASTEFSLTVPSGYQITGGQASNAASSGGYSCSLNGTNTAVDCTGNAPAGSTSYVQMTTSPNPQAGMMLPLKVSFSAGGMASFTLTSK